MTPIHPALVGRPAYLDYNATTPVDPVVVDAIIGALTADFGNPSSGHEYGRAAAEASPIARATRSRCWPARCGAVT